MSDHILQDNGNDGTQTTSSNFQGLKVIEELADFTYGIRLESTKKEEVEDIQEGINEINKKRKEFGEMLDEDQTIEHIILLKKVMELCEKKKDKLEKFVIKDIKKDLIALEKSLRSHEERKDWNRKNLEMEKMNKEIQENMKLMMEEMKRMKEEVEKSREEKKKEEEKKQEEEKKLKEIEERKNKEKEIKKLEEQLRILRGEKQEPECTANKTVEKKLKEITIEYKDFIKISLFTIEKEDYKKIRDINEEWMSLFTDMERKIEPFYQLLLVLGTMSIYSKKKPRDEDGYISVLDKVFKDKKIRNATLHGLENGIQKLLSQWGNMKTGDSIRDDLVKMEKLDEDINGLIDRYNKYSTCLNPKTISEKTIIECLIENIDDCWKKDEKNKGILMDVRNTTTFYDMKTFNSIAKMNSYQEKGKYKESNKENEPYRANGSKELRYRQPRKEKEEVKKEERSKAEIDEIGAIGENCEHCGRTGHDEESCWKKHPHLRPKFRPKKFFKDGKKFNKNNSNYSSVSKINDTEGIIGMIDANLRRHNTRIKSSLPRGKVRVELVDEKGNKYRFLVDSGSDVHVLRKEIVQDFKLPFKKKEIKRFRGLGKDGRIKMPGISLATLDIGTKRHEIGFIVAEEFPENLLSWQRLKNLGTIMWFENEQERIIVIGSYIFREEEDGIYRPTLSKILDLKELKKKMEDKEDGFELIEKQFEMSDTTELLRSKIVELEGEKKILVEELRKLKELIKIKEKNENDGENGNGDQEKEESKGEDGINGIIENNQKTSGEEKDVDKKLEEVFEQYFPIEDEEGITDEIYALHEGNPVNEEIPQKKEYKIGDKVEKGKLKDIIHKFAPDMEKRYGKSFEKIIENCRKEEEEEEIKEMEGMDEEEKERYKKEKEEEEMLKKQEDILIERIHEEVERAKFRELFAKKMPKRNEGTREEKKRKKKIEKKMRELKMEKRREMICNISESLEQKDKEFAKREEWEEIGKEEEKGMSEEEKERIKEHNRKVAGFDPRDKEEWKEMLEKSLFSDEELEEIKKELDDEMTFQKGTKPWIDDYEGWINFKLRNLECDNKQRDELKELVARLIKIPPPTFKQTFENNEGKGVEIKISPENRKKEAIRHMTKEQIEAASPTINDWLKLGYIEEMDEEKAENIVNLVVHRKGEKVRVCMDYSKSNMVVENEFGSFLSTQDMVDGFDPEAKIGFVIDLKSAFHNVLLSEESSRLCCFYFNGKVYAFKVLFFGIKNGPFLFNEFVRKRINVEGLHRYIDDMFKFTRTVEELIATFRRVTELCEKHHIAISPEKLQFGKRLKILGFVWKEGKLMMDINKFIALRYVIMIRKQKDLMKNLGIFRYIACFTPGLNNKLEYFHKKCHEKNWSWTKEDAVRLQNIWKQMDPRAVLYPHDPKRTTYLQTDAATEKGIGYSIFQYDDEGMIRYIKHYSKSLSDAQKKYSPSELEAYTIYKAIDKDYKYFYGTVKILTDAKAVVSIVNKATEEKPNKRIWRWVHALMQFKFEVVHVRGIENKVSDWMSRNPFDIRKFLRYIKEMEEKEDHEQMEREDEEEIMGKISEVKREKYISSITCTEEEVTKLLKQEEEKRGKEEKVRRISAIEKESEGGDSYHTRANILLFVFENMIKEHMSEEDYVKHKMEIQKISEECKDEKVKEQRIREYILKKVVYDPCPFNKNVREETSEDGLSVMNKWGKLNFVNSPYSKELLSRFILRAIEEKKNGNTTIFLCSFKYPGYIQKLLFKTPIEWDSLSILPSVSFGEQNEGRKIFPAMLLMKFDGNKVGEKYEAFQVDNLRMSKGLVFRVSKKFEEGNKEIIGNISGEKEKMREEEEVSEEELDEFEREEVDIDKDVDLSQFDHIDHDEGEEGQREHIKDYDEKMIEPKVEEGEEDAYWLTAMCWLTGKKLPKELLGDEYKVVRKLVERDIDRLSIEGGRLCYQSKNAEKKINGGKRYYVKVEHRWKLYKIAHDANGHQSLPMVMNRLQFYYWPGMYTHIKEKIEQCEKCQFNKKKTEGEKEIRTTPSYTASECGHLDLMGPLMNEGEYKYILVYTDKNTKYTIAREMKSKSAEEATKIIVEDIYHKVGYVPLSISDQGGEFVNNLQKAIHGVTGQVIRTTSPNHSSANMVERKNRTLMAMLKNLINRYHDDWYKHLSSVVWAMNTYIPRGLENSAFELTYGRRPWTLLDWEYPIPRNYESKVSEWYKKLSEDRSHNAVLERRVRLKTRYVTFKQQFKVGELVLVKGVEKDEGRVKKMQPFQKGPYKIISIKLGSAKLERIGEESGLEGKIIDCPTFKLVKYIQPREIPGMKETESNFIPYRIIDEEYQDENEKKVKVYIIEGNTLGMRDVEGWTEDEFDNGKYKELMDKWIKEKEEKEEREKWEKGEKEIYRIITTENIHGYRILKDGKAMFDVTVLGKNNKRERKWLEENKIKGTILIKEYMKKNGFERTDDRFELKWRKIGESIMKN